MPQLRPPGVINKHIRNKGTLILQFIWISIQIIPAIIYFSYRWLYPGEGKSLKGKVALITGAARGLGRGLAIEMAREGCTVACVDINLPGAEETAKLINEEIGSTVAHAYRTNVGKIEDIKELHKNITNDLGPVTYLINNAALILACSILDEKVEDRHYEGCFNVNLLSYFHMMRTFLPDMRKQNDGHIVAIASLSSFSGLAYVSAYAASKWAVRGLMESVRDELKKEKLNIHLTCVHPYFINTSRDYTDNWSVRFPELSVDEVAKATIDGIKHNYFSVSIPNHLYYMLNMLNLFPRYISDQFKEVCYVNIKVPTREMFQKLPHLHIIENSVNKTA